MSDVTPKQRQRYARRVWADKHIGATMTPETALIPMPAHGPLTEWMTRRGTSRCDDISTPCYAVRPQDVPSMDWAAEGQS